MQPIFYRAKEIAKRLSIGVSTWWLWVKINKAPKPIKLSSKITVWKAEDIQTFIDKHHEVEVLNG